MNNKIKLFELAYKKVVLDNDFMAFIFKKYMEYEKISDQELMLKLKCSLEDYYKLGLCRVPNINASDFVKRLNKISEYSHTSELELNKILISFIINL